MTWLRHAPRHVHATVMGHLRTQLGVLGWSVAGSTPFGAPTVTLVDTPMLDGDDLVKQATAGRVFVTLGDEPHPEDQELGGPLAMQPLPLFIDVFMDKHAHAVALAADIRDILLGRIGGKRHLPVVDQSTGVAAEGWTIELTDVERATPQARLALHWQVVKVTCEVHFSEEVY